MEKPSILHSTVVSAYQSRWITLFIAILIGGFGVFSWTRLNIDAYPDISGVQVQIITQYPGKATEQVEEQVTVPLERTMASVARSEVIRSRTIFGLSLVQVLFEPGVSDYWARAQVFENLGTIQLPEGATSSMGSLATAYGEIYRYELINRTKQDPMELRTLNDWVVTPRLLRVPGVVEVANFGGLGKQYAVHLDPEKMMRYGVQLKDIVEAVRSNNSDGGGSIMERGSSTIVIRGLGRVRDYTELNNVFIKNSSGTDVFVRDVGQAVVDHLPRTGVFGKDENPDSVEGIIRLRRGENPSEVLRGIQSAVKELNSGGLPSDVQIIPFYDRTTLIDETLNTVIHNTLMGIFLVIITLFLFLGNLRMALIVSLTVPFSLLFALGLMHLTGIPISLLSVGAIDFGIIVDGAVIVSENVIRHLALRNSRVSRDESILTSSHEVQKPMLFSMLIVILAYLPLLSLSHIEGLLFKPMALTLCFALLGALLFSLYMVPTLSGLLFREDGKHHEGRNRLMEFISAFYERVLPYFLAHRKRVAIVFLTSFFVIFSFVGSRLGTEFLPYMDEGVFWMRANFPEGASLAETSEFASVIRKLIREFPEVSFVTSQTGRNDVGNDPFPMNRVEFMIGLKPREDWKSGRTKLQLESAIREKLKRFFPTLRLNLTQPIIDSVTEDANGTSADLAVELSGKNMDELRRLSRQVVKRLRLIPGSVNVNVEQEGPQPELQIRIDKKKLSRYRMNANNVNSVVNTAIGGYPISSIYEGDRRFDILAKYAPEFVSSPMAVSLLPVFNDQGEAIPLGQVADVTVLDGDTLIARGGGARHITVRCDIRERAQGDFVAEAQRRFESDIKLPEGYRVEWLGMFENLDRARGHFSVMVPLVAGIIFFILFVAFGAARRAAVMVLAIPFAMLGSMVALYVRGMHFSVSAGVGLTALFGVAAMHGILLISYIANLQSKGKTPLEAVLEGASLRLRPVLMTAFVAFVGLLPASLATGIGSDVQRPIATVMVWGIFSSAFLTLFMLPVFYLISEDMASWISRRFKQSDHIMKTPRSIWPSGKK